MFRRCSAYRATPKPRRLTTHATLAISSCPELRCLQKAPIIRSIRFKRTTPGLASRLLLAPATTQLVDPSHPLAHLSPHQLIRIVPQYRCPLFSAHAYPHAVLNQFPDPEHFKLIKGKATSSELDAALERQSRGRDDQRHDKDRQDASLATSARVSKGDRRRAAHTLPMSLLIIASKKVVHKSAVVRNRIKMRLKEALSLVVIRGAEEVDSASDSGDTKIVLNTPEGIGKAAPEASAILEGWTYIIRVSLEMYRCPWPSLVTSVREALVRMNAQGIELEAKWHRNNHAKVLGGNGRRSDKGGLSQQNQDSQSNSRARATISSTFQPHSKTLAFVGKPDRPSSRPSPMRWPQGQDEHAPIHVDKRDNTHEPARSPYSRGPPHTHSPRSSRVPSKPR